jgi:hypothetical protein
MAHPQLIAEQRFMLGLLPRTAAARTAVARLTTRWEVARMAAGHPTLRWEVARMAAVGPMAVVRLTLRWEHPMAAVGPMVVVRLTAAARTAAGQAAITAEGAALVSLGRPISGCDGVPIGCTVIAGSARWRGGRSAKCRNGNVRPSQSSHASWAGRHASSLPRCGRRNHLDYD